MQYVTKLKEWLTKWAGAGTQYQLATEIHEYLGNAPMVRIVNRAGHMVTISTSGVITTAQVAWNWDSTSNPERSGFWSELWIIVYPTQWAIAPGSWGDGEAWGAGDGFGLGHQVSRVEVDAIRSIVDQWKMAGSYVRAIVWTSDPTLFDPATPASLPAGTWGQWDSGGRNLTTCRYWEFLYV